MTATTISLNYSISANSTLSIPVTGKLKYKPSDDGSNEVENLKNLLKPLFAANEDDLSLQTSFYIGKYDQDKQDFVGLNDGEYTTIYQKLSQKASDEGLPTSFDYSNNAVLTFTPAEDDDGSTTDYFNVLKKYVANKDITREMQGFRQCADNGESIVFKSKHIVQVIHPNLDISYLSLD